MPWQSGFGNRTKLKERYLQRTTPIIGAGTESGHYEPAEAPELVRRLRR